MGNSWIELVLALAALVFGGAAEELLPKLYGVGFPALLAAVHVVAVRRNAAAAYLFAVAAGAMEDSLSSLPFLTSVSFCVLVVLLVRRLEIPRLAMAFTFPIYHVWIGVWVAEMQGSVFLRMVLALPVGLAAVFVAGALLGIAERKAGLDEVN